MIEREKQVGFKGGVPSKFEKKRMVVRREFYLQKNNILVTMYECTMHQFHENLN